MKINRVSSNGGFKVLETTALSQSAVMKLSPKESSSEEMNTHPHSDQTLVLLNGTLLAEIAQEKMQMHAGDSVIVPSGTPHRFSNISDEVATSFSVYSPPAYPAGESD